MAENNKFEEFEDENEWPSKEERILGAVSYLPFWFLLPLFISNGNRSKFVDFHTKQWGIIFWIYFIINLILRIFLFFWIFTLLYFWIAIFWAMKAYNWEIFEFGFVKKLIDKLNGK